jgi:hypothetical protein
MTDDFVTIIGETPLDGYEAPELFPEAYRIRDREMLQQYVIDEMDRMAQEGTLIVTHVMNQDPRVRDLAGRAVFGLYVDDENTERADIRRIPESLLRYRVKIKKLGRWPIEYKEGMGVSGYKSTARADSAVSLAAPKKYTKRSCPRYKAIIKRTSKSEVEVDLQQAWQILQQYGWHCRRAKGRLQADLWRYQEIFPEPREEPTTDDFETIGPEPSRRRGRPPKRSQEAVG